MGDLLLQVSNRLAVKKGKKKKTSTHKDFKREKKVKKKITTNPDYTKKENEYLIRNIYLVCVCVCVCVSRVI